MGSIVIKAGSVTLQKNPWSQFHESFSFIMFHEFYIGAFDEQRRPPVKVLGIAEAQAWHVLILSSKQHDQFTLRLHY